MTAHTDPKNFKPGKYKHYKRAGHYVALQLVTHHDTDELFVVYVCGDTGRVRIREWASRGKDSWSDLVEREPTNFVERLEAASRAPGEVNTSRLVPRFEYVGPAT